MTAIRPRRSVLYMPGSNARALEKAKTIAADALILDLEDAVAPDAKAAAREQVCAVVKEGGYGPRELVIRAPNGLARFVARKGSIAVNGVSLTVNEVADTADGCDFSLNLIPHTSAVTTLGRLAPGHSVNLEVDLIARYVERMLPPMA